MRAIDIIGCSACGGDHTPLALDTVVCPDTGVPITIRSFDVTEESFEDAVDAVWSEMEYQNRLPRRTADSEAVDPPGFATLLRVYLRKLEDDWATQEGNEAALHQLRKIAAIAIRGMIYSGIRFRDDPGSIRTLTPEQVQQLMQKIREA